MGSEAPSASGPLAGITVVALEQAVSAPLCTRTLADLGARVIKVENRRGGDFTREFDDVVRGMAAHFVWLNRGKESLALDLKKPAALDVMHRLLASSDVLVSNLAPGATARLGIGPADLAERHPHLVALEISGYGAGGPLSHKRAYDLLVQAESGACSVTGWAGAPAKPGPPMADACTGLYSAIAILARLRDRDRAAGFGGAAGAGGDPVTGGGIAVSMFDTMAELMGYQLTWTRYTGIDQEPIGMSSPAVSPYGAYPTADGQTVVLGTTNDREWQRLAGDLMGRPDLAADERYQHNPDRVAQRPALDAELAAWCARQDLADIQAAADATGIGNARYNTPSEVIAHPHLSERGRWREVDTPVGPVTALLPPAIIDGYESPMGAVPEIGEHTDTVLADLGFDTEQIAQLRKDGVAGPA